MTPPFSWSRQHLRASTTIHSPEILTAVINPLPTWGKWWIATPLWKWRSTPCTAEHIRFLGTPLFLGRMRLDFQWTIGSPTTLTMTMTFDPNGWIGLTYWLALWPVHRIIFPILLYHISQKAVAPQ